MQSDFTVVECGLVNVLTPHTEAAHNWIADHIDPSAQRWTRGVHHLIEPRYLPSILEGIEQASLTWERG